MTGTGRETSHTYTALDVYDVVLEVTDEKEKTTRFDIRKIKIGHDECSCQSRMTNPKRMSSSDNNHLSGRRQVQFKAQQVTRKMELSIIGYQMDTVLRHNGLHFGGGGVPDKDGYIVFFIPSTGHGYPSRPIIRSSCQSPTVRGWLAATATGQKTSTAADRARG